VASSEDEIYSTMFSSLKHPVRRKIIRMLSIKPMTFMEIAEQLDISTSNLTYHLESLGDLVNKMENGQYKLSTFGLATVSAMKGVEEVPEIEPRRKIKLSLKWRAAFAVLMVAVLILASVSALQYISMNHLSSKQNVLAAENKQLLSWGIGTNKVANFLQNVTQIDTNQYTTSLLSNTLQFNAELNSAEELLTYSLTNGPYTFNVDLRFRNNHFSRYQLEMGESSPVFTQSQPDDVVQAAKGVLERYQAYSGDLYLTQMRNLIDAVNTAGPTSVTQGNMTLQITVSGGTTQFLWMYTQNGIDYQAKGVMMTFQNNILITMTDGYFLFTIGSTTLKISQEQAVSMAKNYINTLSWNFNGTKYMNFNVLDNPVSVQLVPHPRGNSVALIPYWYVILGLDRVYPGAVNEVTVGIFADNGQIDGVQMLSG
jgi:DNA-binding transcriptional ArsR family regulator